MLSPSAHRRHFPESDTPSAFIAVNSSSQSPKDGRGFHVFQFFGFSDQINGDDLDAPKKEAHDVGLLCAGFEGGKGKAPQKRRGGLQCPRRLVLIRLAFAAMRPYGFLAGRRAGLGKEVGGAGSKFAWDEVHTCGGGVRRNAVECSEDLTNVSFPPTRLWAEPPPHTCDCEGGPPPAERMPRRGQRPERATSG